MRRNRFNQPSVEFIPPVALISPEKLSELALSKATIAGTPTLSKLFCENHKDDKGFPFNVDAYIRNGYTPQFTSTLKGTQFIITFKDSSILIVRQNEGKKAFQIFDSNKREIYL